MKNYILEVGRKMIPLTGISNDLPPNIDTILDNTLKRDDIFVVGEKNKGVILAVVFPYIFNPSVLMANELIFWIEKPYRQTKFVYKLMQDYVTKAKECGASKILTNGLTTLNLQGADRLYSTLGFTLLQNTFIKDL